MNKINRNLTKGFFFLFCFLIVLSCEKEDNLSINSSQALLSILENMYASQFTANELVSNQTPQWSKYTLYNSSTNETIIEVPFSSSNKTQNQNLILSASFKDKELVETTLHRFIDTKTHHFPSSIANTGEFNGFYLLYNLNGELISGNVLENGKPLNPIKSIYNKTKSNDSLLITAKPPGKEGPNYDPFGLGEDIVIQIDWYMLTYYTYTFPDNSVLYYNITNEYTHTEFITVPNYGDTPDPIQTATEERTINTNRDYIKIIDSLSGKAKCVYQKMVDNDNNINWILENFKDGTNPSEFDLKFEMSTTLSDLTNASTATPNQSGIANTFVISINQNRTENINTTLTIARTIIHEGIHARLWEFAYRKGTTVSANDFPGVYEYMRTYGKNWDHQQMADYYRSTIVTGLRQFDNAQHSDAYYNALAWEGLSEIKDLNGNGSLIYTEAWKKLSPTEQQNILQIITDEKQNGNKTCD